MGKVKTLRDILNHVEISEKFKHTLIISAVMAVHIFLVFLFSCFHILPLILLNIGSVILYIICLIAVRQNKGLLWVFYATYLEIIIQSVTATICIGWQFGFPQYLIALVPFGYYMCHTLIGNRRRYIIATVMGLVAFCSFIGCRILSMYFGSLYDPELPEIIEVAVYIFNAICNFVFLFMVTAIYIIEMQTATNKLRRQNAVLDKLANIDPLTGLYNRRSMQTFFSHAMEAEEKPFCLIMCDIDDFKVVNDTYGHDMGDNVLKEIAGLIQKRVDKHGYACRWGGEEILLLIDCGIEQSRVIAEAIRQDIQEFHFPVGDENIQCSITIGVAMHQKGETIDNTITQADNNLYYGKCHGKNQVVA